jgi:DNA excision repair protein ERCC-2
VSAPRRFTVSVRELIEFVCRTGDLVGRGDFTGPERAVAGMRGHQRLQQSRPAGYQREVVVSRRLADEGFILELNGRVDGVMAAAVPPWIEEIKTVTAHWSGEADPLHWAQGRAYAALLLDTLHGERIEVRLSYYDLETDHVTPFRQLFTRADLEGFLARITGEYLQWLRREHLWLNQRNDTVRTAPFPFPAYRAGQRELAVAAYRACARGGRLFAEAPTGIGKTISVLFPAAKALAEGKVEKILYLTAKTSGRALAEATLDDLRRAGMKLRAVTLTAREKVCVRDGRPCERESCPLARGYYDRRKAGLRAALEAGRLTRTTVAEIAQAHQLCPYALALDAAAWADVVIGDYNHVFDPAAQLRSLVAEGSGPYALLVDEAHNLPDRAREMFSATLRHREIQALRRAVGRAVPPVTRALDRLHRWFLAARARLPAVAAGENAPADVSAEPPDVLPCLEEFCRQAGQWLARNEPAPWRDELFEGYLAALAFQRAAQRFGDDFVTVIEGGAGEVDVRLLCLDPARMLRRALERVPAAVFFSATLSPLASFRRPLGGAEEDVVLQLPSPFPPGNLCVLIENRIATTFKARGGSYDAVAAVIAATVVPRAGNYLVYFPSYAYLEAVLERYRALRPQDEVLRQHPDWSEEQRAEFLAWFEAGAPGTRVGFAVLGGVFGEAIDLVGERLQGAVIVGVGLPQLGLERNLIRAWHQRRGEDGFEQAYVVPGMNRVRQAAGRVIRSETDRGVVVLVDQRYRETRFRSLLPSWWRPRTVRGAPAVEQAAREFWSSPPP